MDSDLERAQTSEHCFRCFIETFHTVLNLAKCSQGSKVNWQKLPKVQAQGQMEELIKHGSGFTKAKVKILKDHGFVKLVF